MEIIIKHKKTFGLIFWLWGFIIIVLSILPNTPKLEIDLNNKILRLDYVIHFIVYFTLSILFLLWKADKYLKIKSNLLFYFLLGALLFAGLSEFIQTFIPGRSFNPIDFLFNTGGIILGIIAPKLILK